MGNDVDGKADKQYAEAIHTSHQVKEEAHYRHRKDHACQQIKEDGVKKPTRNSPTN